VGNTQTRRNENAGYANAGLNNGSEHIRDYTPALDDDRATRQRSWETEVGTVEQNDYETVIKKYTVDYLSEANRDILVTEEGSYVQRYIYDVEGARLSAEYSHADGTARNTTNADGEYGENPASDFAVNDISKVWYRVNMLGTSLYAVDGDGGIIAHAEYDAWGVPLTETYTDTNYSGLESLTGFTSYTWDVTLELHFAQNRFYDAATHRFTQQDPAMDGGNWYVYVGGNPLVRTDPWGLDAILINKVVDNYPAAIFSVEHMSAFFQDSDGEWWYFFWGDVVITAKAPTNILTSLGAISEWVKDVHRDEIVKAKQI
jgi:RHS repeat-associated protein